MKHSRQRNARIAEELILFAYKFGAEEIKVSLSSNENETKISIEAYQTKISDDVLESITCLLSTGRCKEMEEYYWNLTGESDTDFELSLIGVMTDKSDIYYDKENKVLKINLIRII